MSDRLRNAWVWVFLTSSALCLVAAAWAAVHGHPAAVMVRNVSGLAALVCVAPLFIVGVIPRRPAERAKLQIIVGVYAVGVAVLAGSVVLRHVRDNRLGVRSGEVVVVDGRGRVTVRSSADPDATGRALSEAEGARYRFYSDFADWATAFGLFLLIPLAWTLWTAREHQRFPEIYRDDEQPSDTEPSGPASDEKADTDPSDPTPPNP